MHLGAAPRLLILCLALSHARLTAEVKLLIREGLPIANTVYLNGHGPYRFLIDTGTNANLIRTKLAQSLGLTPTFRTELVSSAGSVTVPGTGGIAVSLDTALAENQPFLFQSLDAIRANGPDVQGVLGQAFLSRFDYSLDLRRGRLEFRKQQPEGPRTRLTMTGGRPTVSTSLGDLVLDSGAVRLILFGVEPDNPLEIPDELRTLAGSRPIGTTFSKPLVIEGKTIWRGNAIAMPHAAESGVRGLLPLSFFSAVYICNSEGYAILRK
jgi:hypothetical protein